MLLMWVTGLRFRRWTLSAGRERRWVVGCYATCDQQRCSLAGAVLLCEWRLRGAKVPRRDRSVQTFADTHAHTHVVVL